MIGLAVRARNLCNVPGSGDVMEGSSSSMNRKTLQRKRTRESEEKTTRVRAVGVAEWVLLIRFK